MLTMGSTFFTFFTVNVLSVDNMTAFEHNNRQTEHFVDWTSRGPTHRLDKSRTRQLTDNVVLTRIIKIVLSRNR